MPISFHHGYFNHGVFSSELGESLVNLEPNSIIPVQYQGLSPAINMTSPELHDSQDRNTVVSEIDIATTRIVRQHELKDVVLRSLVLQPISGELEAGIDTKSQCMRDATGVTTHLQVSQIIAGDTISIRARGRRVVGDRPRELVSVHQDSVVDVRVVGTRFGKIEVARSGSSSSLSVQDRVSVILLWIIAVCLPIE